MTYFLINFTEIKINNEIIEEKNIRKKWNLSYFSHSSVHFVIVSINNYAIKQNKYLKLFKSLCPKRKFYLFPFNIWDFSAENTVKGGKGEWYVTVLETYLDMQKWNSSCCWHQPSLKMLNCSYRSVTTTLTE